MEVGTAEPVVEPESLRKIRSRLMSSASSGSSSGNGGSNGGSDNGDERQFGEQNLGASDTDNGDKAKVVTWFLLLVVGMTFAGLIGAYVMVSTNKAAEWKPFDLPIQLWISTILMLISSISYHIAKRSIDADAIDAGRKWLLVTTVLGAAFISSQLLAWLELSRRGLYLHGNPYAGFFYILTAVHVAHVLGGIVALSTIVLNCWNGGGSESDRLRRRKLARAVGWYWHFMGAIWLVLFVLLGFWR
ncbi:MAG: heme-copper oxidase subunit III [Pyrinomonadaceae bacterium]